jgi:hypothetical protein
VAKPLRTAEGQPAHGHIPSLDFEEQGALGQTRHPKPGRNRRQIKLPENVVY